MSNHRIGTTMMTMDILKGDFLLTGGTTEIFGIGFMLVCVCISLMVQHLNTVEV